MKKYLLFTIITFCALMFGLNDGLARVRLPQHIASGMVLQREQPLTLHGWGEAGEKITLTFRGKKYRATTDSQGLWQITLPAQKPGGPFTMRVNDTTLTDVWVGDVILCAGQSNMELPVSRVVDLLPMRSPLTRIGPFASCAYPPPIPSKVRKTTCHPAAGWRLPLSRPCNFRRWAISWPAGSMSARECLWVLSTMRWVVRPWSRGSTKRRCTTIRRYGTPSISTAINPMCSRS